MSHCGNNAPPGGGGRTDACSEEGWDHGKEGALQRVPLVLRMKGSIFQTWTPIGSSGHPLKAGSVVAEGLPAAAAVPSSPSASVHIP
jgi:hypothetical protein